MESRNALNDNFSKSKEIKNVEIKEDKINNLNTNKINNKNKNKYSNEEMIGYDDDVISVVINKNTEIFMNSKNKTDLIQCALEYNSYLIENLIKEKDNISQLEYETSLNRLYHNLSVLSESFELYENKFKLINNKISNKTKENDNDNNRKNIEDKNKNDLDDMTRIYSNTITNIKMELPL
jgi:hypothetical protein